MTYSPPRRDKLLKTITELKPMLSGYMRQLKYPADLLRIVDTTAESSTAQLVEVKQRNTGVF